MTAFDLRLKRNNDIILLDIIVTKDKELRALMPMFESHTLIPLVEKERREFFKTVNPNRMNENLRQFRRSQFDKSKTPS